jgi:hypothetical protein
LSGGEYKWLNIQKTRKIEKVTSAVSPDPSVGRCAQDDDFVGGSKASGRAHLHSFIHPTRNLVVIEIAAGQQKQPDFVQRCSAQSSQQVTSSKSPLFR